MKVPFFDKKYGPTYPHFGNDRRQN